MSLIKIWKNKGKGVHHEAVKFYAASNLCDDVVNHAGSEIR